MKPIFISNTPDAEAYGSLTGYINTTYATLVAKLGEPIRYDWHETDGKVRVEWIITVVTEFDASVVAIYDWKSAQPIEEITEWNVGGNTIAARDLAEFIDGEFSRTGAW